MLSQFSETSAQNKFIQISLYMRLTIPKRWCHLVRYAVEHFWKSADPSACERGFHFRFRFAVAVASLSFRFRCRFAFVSLSLIHVVFVSC